MKQIIILLLLLPILSFSQNTDRRIDNIKVKKKSKLIGDVTIGSSSFDASAILGIASTTKGLLIPRMTTGQRDAIGSPTTSLMIYNTTDNEFQFFETTWQAVGDDGTVVDSSFVTLQLDTAKAFNNTNLQFTDSAIFQEHLQTDKSFTVNLGLSTMQGIDATSSNSWLEGRDNAGTLLFRGRNDGLIGINQPTPTFMLDIKAQSSPDNLMRFQRSSSANTILELTSTANSPVWNTTNADITWQRFNIERLRITLRGATVNGYTGVAGYQAALGVLGLNAAEAGLVVQAPASPTSDLVRFSSNLNVDRFFAIDKLGNTHIGGFATTVFDGIGSPTIVLAIKNGGTQGTGGIADGIYLYSKDIEAGKTELFAINEKGTDQQLTFSPDSITLGAAATTFAVNSDFITITGDAGANTIATITGGTGTIILTLLFVDGLVTITDDNAHAVNSIDLSAAFTGADDTTLTIRYNGISWYEISRSSN